MNSIYNMMYEFCTKLLFLSILNNVKSLFSLFD